MKTPTLPRKLLLSLAAAAALGSAPAVLAQAVTQAGQAEVSVKANKDQVTARAVARRQAEADAIRAALKLRLNVDATSGKAQEAIAELVKSLNANLRTTYTLEGDILTARTTLSVDSAEFTDLARSLGLQNMNVMEASSIVFLIDEYWGIATNLDPSKPLVSEVEFFQDRSSASSGSSFSDTSSKSSDSSSLQGSVAASSQQASSSAASQRTAVAGSQSSSFAGNERTAVAGSQSSSFAGRDQRAAAVQDGAGGSAAAARQTSVAGAQQSQFAGSRQTSVAGAQQSSFAGASQSASASASSSDTRMAASVNAQTASSTDNKNVQSSSFSNQQKDVTSFRSKTVFPDVNNAKPSDQASALIAPRLAQVTKQYGLEYTPERDLRETGKGRMLIADIETQRRWDFYTQAAAKNPYNANFVVFGSSVMNAEGKSPSGRTLCSGMLKLESFSTGNGRGLVAGTLVKRAEGSSDQDCRSNLSTALATELAQTVGNAATRELQRIARDGQAYTVTLFSAARLSRSIGGAFEDALRKMAGEVREQSRGEGTRVYTLSAKGGDLVRRIERVLDDLGADMKNAEVQSKGNRVVVCVEGRCPSEY